MNPRAAAPAPSNERLIRFLSATPEQQEAIDRILSGQLALDALALRAAEAAKGPLLLRVKDAAVLLGVHRTTLWRLVKAGRLETVELLGSLRVRRADIEALACGQTCRSGTVAGGRAPRLSSMEGRNGASGLASGKAVGK